jgi:1-carboxybiuret hydrolase
VSGLRDASEIAGAVGRGDATALEFAEAALARVHRLDPKIGAFSTVTAARARAEAAAIDARRRRGEPLPPLAGVPYAVKDLFDVQGLTTLAGSQVLAAGAPATRDAVLVQRMNAAGAVLVGTLRMDEFAYGFTTENSHYGPTRNPHDLTRVAGGSSGGSGAAVGAALVPLALGSDTNGSIRVPASFCGIFGLKPTYARLPRRGSYPFVHSLDHLGPFARRVDDLAATYDALQGPDLEDHGCAQRPIEPTRAQLGNRRPLRVAVLGGYFEDHAEAQARAAVRAAADALGASDIVTLPLAEAARASAFVITAAEGGALHRDHLRTQYALMEPRSRDRLAAGAAVPAGWYLQAQRVRALYRAQVLGLLARFDVLIAASTPLPATPIGAETMTINGRELPTRANIGVLTQPISCVGLPVAAVPIALGEPLPIGVQLIGAPWREDQVLQAAWRLESSGAAQAATAAGFGE